MERRNFLKQNAILASAISLSPLSTLLDEVGVKGHNLGLQLFSVPKLLSENFREGIALLASLGYKDLEFFGPYDFSAEIAKKRWAGAAQMLGFSGSGNFGYSIMEVKSILKEHGMKTSGTHTDMDTLLDHMGPLADHANAMGQQYLTLPAIPDERRKTLDDYKRVADDFNKIGKAAKKYGLKFGYHNHGYGLKATDGVMPLEIIIQNTDPSLVFLEMDIFWTAAGGVDPISLLKKYPQRYKMLHIKDMKEKKTFSGDGGDVTQWIPLFPNMTSAGEGVMDLKKLLKTALKAGVDHYYVEQDMVADPKSALGKSAAFLKSKI